jgi:hypothetical protein
MWKKIFSGVILTLTAIIIIVARRNKYLEFHNNYFQGTIDKIYRYKSYVMIDVDNVEYSIIPYPVVGNANLDDIAKSGDSLYKHTGNDTLELVHQGAKTYYTVAKW